MRPDQLKQYRVPHKRGDVVRLNLPEARGHEQRGTRYGVVVQGDEFNEYLSTVLIVPTSTTARPASFHPPVRIGGRSSFALIEQVRAIDIEARVRGTVGTIAGTAEMDEIDEQLGIVFGLEDF